MRLYNRPRLAAKSVTAAEFTPVRYFDTMAVIMKNQRACLPVMLLASFLLLPGHGAAVAKDPLVLAATIFPAADIARRIAGPGIPVIQVLPAGASPHTFDLTPGQVRELQKARMIFKIGGVDDWIDGVAESLRRVTIVDLRKNVPLMPSHEDGHEHGAGARHEPDFDPHYWLSAENAIVMARNIADALRTVEPSRADLFEANYRELALELSRLHAEIKTELSALKNNKMIVFHDGWRYFAAAYGLEIVAVFQASPGREPAPRDLQKIYAVARKYAVRAIFSEPQLPQESLEPLVHDLGLNMVVLDPLGGAVPGDSYAGLLRRNARAIRDALGH
jgi:zinc transport system substrate-binding protein